jgi:hypothetical protein
MASFFSANAAIKTRRDVIARLRKEAHFMMTTTYLSDGLGVPLIQSFSPQGRR